MTQPFWCTIIVVLMISTPSFALQLIDGQNFRYDVGQNCALIQGSHNAYATLYQLRVNGSNYQGQVAGLTTQGREVYCEDFVEPSSGLTLKRQIYVPKTHNFARFSEILINPNTTERRVSVEIFGHLGSGHRTTLVKDLGYLLISDDNLDESSGPMPVLLHYHSQNGHPQAAVYQLNGNRLTWVLPEVVVPPQSQVRVVYFIAQTIDIEAAEHIATLIFNNATALYEGISLSEYSQLVNFQPPTPTPKTDLSQAPLLTVGERRFGRLMPEDSWSQRRAATLADYYSLPLEAKQQVTIQMTAAFNTYLYLFDTASGQTVLAANDDTSPTSTHAELVFTAPKSQVYYLEATSHDAQAQGEYTLEIMAGAPKRQPQVYNFEFPAEKMEAPATVTFSDFSQDGALVEWCWQFGDGSPRTCTAEHTITHTFEQPGQYSVGLIVRDEHDQYGYRNQQVDVSLTPEGVVLPVSNTVLGELASADPRSQTRPNAFADRYRLTSIPSGQELVIEMTSEQFDSYLYLYDEFNRLLRQDNNSGRAQQARIRYTPVHQGDLLVEATSFKDNTLGSYRLSLELGQQRPIREVPIEASTSLSNPLQNLFIARLPSSFETQFVLWDFGDGSPVAATDIAVVSHVYPHSGQFTVTVTAMDAQGQELIGEQSFIINQHPFIPVARFRASPLFGESPLRVFFNNESFSSIDGDELSYVWQFGDGKVSTLLNPAHTFSQEGTYQVILHAYSGRNQQSASYSVPISVIDRSSPLIPVVNPARLRPQVLMAGFDPMLVDVLDTDVKVFAIVRPGAEPIQNVRIMHNNSDFILVMQHVATYANGDQRYEAVITLAKGDLPVTTYANLFGDQLGQFRIQVIDQAEQFHAFPNLEIGHNPPLTTAPTSLHIEPLRQTGIRRRQPQVLAAGFDPALVDINESEFLVKAIVREGLLPIEQVLLIANQAEFSLPMRLQEILPNGDKLFVVNYTYPHDTVEMGTWGHLFGDQPQQFQIKVIDQAHYVHQFPQLKIGNFPQQ